MSHASLVAALLEHAGHLAETVSQYTGKDTSFPKCIRYVVYTFFNSSPDDSYILDIEQSAIIHQKYLQLNKDIPELRSAFQSPSWITQIHNSSQKQKQMIDMITHISGVWESWNPVDDIGHMLKRSIDDIL